MAEEVEGLEGQVAGDSWTKEEAEQGSELKAMLPGHKGRDGFNYNCDHGK